MYQTLGQSLHSQKAVHNLGFPVVLKVTYFEMFLSSVYIFCAI